MDVLAKGTEPFLKRVKSQGITPRKVYDHTEVMLPHGYPDFGPGEVSLGTQLAPGLELRLFLLSAAMPCVTDAKTAIALAKAGGLGVIHRHYHDDVGFRHHLAMILEVRAAGQPVGVAIGPSQKDSTEELCAAGATALFYQVAACISRADYEALTQITKVAHACDVPVFAGNVSSQEAAEKLLKNFPLVGQIAGCGSGSICETPNVTSAGSTLLDAVEQAAGPVRAKGLSLIADGGIGRPSDIPVLAAYGATAFMMGKVFAGVSESAADFVGKDRQFKEYYGAGSVRAREMLAGKQSDRYPDRAVHGISGGMVPHVGPLAEYLEDHWLAALREGLFNQGVRRVEEIYQYYAKGERHPIVLSEEARRKRGAHSVAYLSDLDKKTC